MDYRGIDGFLGTRASIMLDVVFVALVAVLPLLAWSIYLVRCRRAYSLHKRLQVILAALLLVAVSLFEIDMRLVSGWRDRAEPSPYYPPMADPPGWLDGLCRTVLGMSYVPGAAPIALAVHLVFATTTALLWVVVTTRALRHFPEPPRPGAHSRAHRFWGWLAAIDLALTAITGWVFYWLAFVAS